MALRIGGARKPAAPVEEEIPMEEMAEEMPAEEPMPEEMPEMPEEDMMGMEDPGGVLDPAVAGYKGPEMGPFNCGNCNYYAGEGTCLILAAPVDEAGLCNIFAAKMGQMDEPMDEEPMPEEEMPVEEPMPEEELPAE